MEAHSLKNVNIHVESEHQLITSLIVLLNFIYILLYKKKTSGTEVRRTPGVKLRFVGFNFGQIK